MTPEFDETLEAVRHIVGAHHSPDKPLVSNGERDFTPRELFEEMQKGTPVGLELLRNAREFLADVLSSGNQITERPSVTLPASAEDNPGGFLAVMNFHEALATIAEQARSRGFVGDANRLEAHYKNITGVAVSERHDVREKLEKMIPPRASAATSENLGPSSE